MPMVDLGVGLGSLREAVLTGHPSAPSCHPHQPWRGGAPCWTGLCCGGTLPRLKGQVTAACLWLLCPEALLLGSLADGGGRGIEMWILPITHGTRSDPVLGRVGTGLGSATGGFLPVPWVSLWCRAVEVGQEGRGKQALTEAPGTLSLPLSPMAGGGWTSAPLLGTACPSLSGTWPLGCGGWFLLGGVSRSPSKVHRWPLEWDSHLDVWEEVGAWIT